MKKLLAIVCIVCFAFSVCACTGITNPKIDKIIDKAERDLSLKWKQLYRDSPVETDGHFEIKNTRVLFIKDDTDVEEFQDIAYIVEFDLYTDYMGSAPYYMNVGVYDSVSVLKDGTTVVNQLRPIQQYRSITYSYDFSNIIESITDYGDQYNVTKTLE